MKFRENAMKAVFISCACMSIAAVAAICIFMFASGIPAIKEIGLLNFIFGRVWRPRQELFGIFPMIVASVYVTAGAILGGVPLGVLTAIFLVKYCPKRIYRLIKPAINLLAGIPSVVYGFFGLVVVVPVIQRFTDTSGKGILTASIILAIMVLPTIINTSEAAIRAVPNTYFEGSLALGATKERSIFRSVLPAASSGVLSGVILGIGRAVGETMAVVMVAGNSAIMPHAVTSRVRTLTANIVLEMGYAADLHRDALIATALVLFVFILIINLCFSAVKRGGRI